MLPFLFSLCNKKAIHKCPYCLHKRGWERECMMEMRDFQNSFRCLHEQEIYVWMWSHSHSHDRNTYKERLSVFRISSRKKQCIWLYKKRKERILVLAAVIVLLTEYLKHIIHHEASMPPSCQRLLHADLCKIATCQAFNATCWRLHNINSKYLLSQKTVLLANWFKQSCTATKRFLICHWISHVSVQTLHSD